MSDDITEPQPDEAPPAEETPEQQPAPRFEFAVIVQDEVTGEWGEPIGEIDGTLHDALLVAGAIGGEVVARQVGPWGIVKLAATAPDDASSLLDTDPAPEP